MSEIDCSAKYEPEYEDLEDMVGGNPNCSGDGLPEWSGGVCAEGKAQRELTGHTDIDAFLEECFQTMSAKGRDYRQGNSDLLHNFRSVAAAVGLRPDQVWFTYFYKHYAALTTYIKENGQSESEPIEGRIKDLIVYLLLFYRMTQERTQKEPVEIKREIKLECSVEYKEQKSFVDALARTYEEQIAQLKDELRKERNAKLIGVEPAKLVEIGVSGEKLKINPEKMYRLAGGVGEFVPPELIERGRDILRRMDEMKKEQDLSYGVQYRKFSPKLEQMVLEEVLAETIPLHVRERDAGFEPGMISKISTEIDTELPAPPPLKGHHL